MLYPYLSLPIAIPTCNSSSLRHFAMVCSNDEQSSVMLGREMARWGRWSHPLGTRAAASAFLERL
jgi:hypothetical protein